MNYAEEYQPAPLVCPHCDTEFEFVEGQLEYSCQNCGKYVDNMPAQLAYSRGYDAFFAGQRVFMVIPPKQRTRSAYAEQAREATQLYTEAYTAIQVAFEDHLADSQRYKAIEIMASIANLFTQTNLISPLEAYYWTSLMIEQVNQKEYTELNYKLSQPSSGIFSLLVRLNLRRRRAELKRGLAGVAKKISLIEQNIAFATPLKVRKETPSGSKA